jgi:hypothetical protein
VALRSFTSCRLIQPNQLIMKQGANRKIFPSPTSWTGTAPIPDPRIKARMFRAWSDDMFASRVPRCPNDKHCRTGYRTEIVAPSSPWRTAAAGGSESAPELIGSSPIPHHLASIGQHLRTKAPSLRRLSPDSSVLRASPSSLPTRSPKLQALVLGRDFPCCAALSLPACRLHYPGETLRAPSGYLLSATAFPDF